MNTRIGIIKSYHHKRGYGFISIKGLDEDIFFHASDISIKNIDYEPSEYDRVEFFLLENQKGYHAYNVKFIGTNK